MRLPFDNSYARDLPGLYVPWKPAPAPQPQLLYLNRGLAQELGLDADTLDGEAGAALWSGNVVPEGAEPLAQAYAGHQFGGFSPQLGDGRALLLGELIDTQGRRRDIAFKGSGRTPFSRGGDGRAAVGPMLREVLIGEAMHALGIPTTRALAVAATGEPVIRENVLPGAVLTRVAASHLRVGTFQYVASRGEYDRLRLLADYAIARHDPDLAAMPDPAQRILGLLRGVGQRQAALIAQWVNVGFIHGVMNTDNMTISGETIDYGPCAFMEAYDPDTVFSSIDRGGRYAFGNQPHIARWNLARLAEALLPLLCDREDEASVQQAVAQVTEVIDAFPGWYDTALLRGRRAKLGLLKAGASADRDAADTSLAENWLTLLQAQCVDHTQGWRALTDAAQGHDAPLQALQGCSAGAFEPWLQRWRERLAQDGAAGASAEARQATMRQANPAVIPRNHRVEEALAAATDGDMAPFERLLAALQQPFDASAEIQRYLEPAPASVTDGYRTFCGT